MAERGAENAFGLLAEFDDPALLIGAVRATRKAGYRNLDAFTPFPVDGLAEALEFSDRRVAALTLAGGILGAAGGFGIQAYANLDYPIDVGGQPLIAVQAFMPVTLSLCLLSGIFFAVFGMLALNRLPRLHHPLFGTEGFDLTAPDRFFLVVFAGDPRFDPQATAAFLESQHPRRIESIRHTEPSP